MSTEQRAADCRKLAEQAIAWLEQFIDGITTNPHDAAGEAIGLHARQIAEHGRPRLARAWRMQTEAGRRGPAPGEAPPAHAEALPGLLDDFEREYLGPLLKAARRQDRQGVAGEIEEHQAALVAAVGQAMLGDWRAAGFEPWKLVQGEARRFADELGEIAAEAWPAPVSGAGAKPATADGDEAASQQQALTRSQRLALQALARFDAADLATLEAVADRSREVEPSGISRRTAGDAIKRLVTLGLAERPEHERQGARLTLAGRRLASKLAP
ncbi:hypothetical protein ACERK3_16940 [Phycisphaerales bacterium AB-hyl4]|uniref:MarR family transcriptional regulator n=1 Tax=Natronomicrosphaera hydrolytica TaxID=3242702 RepID=A0ABV4UAR1_9BACT